MYESGSAIVRPVRKKAKKKEKKKPFHSLDTHNRGSHLPCHSEWNEREREMGIKVGSIDW